MFQEWAQQIRLRKFQIYNSEWVQAVEREDGDDFVGSNLRGRMAIDDDMDEEEDDDYHGMIGGNNKYGMNMQQNFDNQNFDGEVFVDDDDDDFGYDD